MSKVYKFNDTEFTASENVLRIHNAAIPLQALFAEKLKEYSKGIDIDSVTKQKSIIESLKFKCDSDESYYNEIKDIPGNEDEIKRVQLRMSENKAEYDKHLKRFNADENIKKITEDYEKAIEKTFEFIITEDTLIIPFLHKYLTGDFSKLDYTDINILKFISEVIADFFLLLSQSKMKLKG